MRSFLSTILAVILFTSCAQTQGSHSDKKEAKIPVGNKQKSSGKVAAKSTAKENNGIQKLFFKVWKE